MSYVLIFYMLPFLSHGVGGTAQFADKPSCELAIVTAKKEWFNFTGVCVPYHQ